MAALAEDLLRAGVVAPRVEAEVDRALLVAPVVPPAGQRPGLLADVALRVAAARAEREELHHLAAVVLVRRVFLVVGAVQPEQHRGVSRDREQQLARTSRGRGCGRGSFCWSISRCEPTPGVRGREPVVPDERHALDERAVRANHAVEPPEVVVAPRVDRRDRVAVVVDGLRPDQAVARRMGQRVDGAVEALLREPLLLSRARAETGTPEQPFGLFRAEVASVDGNSACGRHRAVPLSAIGASRRLPEPPDGARSSSANSGRTYSSKVSLSQLARVVGTSAVTDAVRGMSIASATSPK